MIIKLSFYDRVRIQLEKVMNDVMEKGDICCDGQEMQKQLVKNNMKMTAFKINKFVKIL
jgi:hypothetical protein